MSVPAFADTFPAFVKKGLVFLFLPWTVALNLLFLRFIGLLECEECLFEKIAGGDHANIIIFKERLKPFLALSNAIQIDGKSHNNDIVDTLRQSIFLGLHEIFLESRITDDEVLHRFLQLA